MMAYRVFVRFVWLFKEQLFLINYTESLKNLQSYLAQIWNKHPEHLSSVNLLFGLLAYGLGKWQMLSWKYVDQQD